MTNVGRSPLRIHGFELRDNSAALALPDIELPAGHSIVVAGEAADVGDAIAVRVDGGLFNGLANAGDRLVLLTTEGAVVDSLSYGDDASGFGPPLAAPGSGQPLRRRFAANGALVGVQIGSRGQDGARVAATATPEAATDRVSATSPIPTPEARAGDIVAASSPAEAATGREPTLAPEVAHTQPALTQDVADDGGVGGANRAAWVALASVALGALAGVGAFRVRELMGA